jgi:hypothetical protein
MGGIGAVHIRHALHALAHEAARLVRPAISIAPALNTDPPRRIAQRLVTARAFAVVAARCRAFSCDRIADAIAVAMRVARTFDAEPCCRVADWTAATRALDRSGAAARIGGRPGAAASTACPGRAAKSRVGTAIGRLGIGTACRRVDRVTTARWLEQTDLAFLTSDHAEEQQPRWRSKATRHPCPFYSGRPAQSTSGRQRPAEHTPEQQSRLVVQAPRLGTHDVSQKPPRQKPVQQSAFVWHAPAVGVQSGGGGWHLPPTQPKLQHSAFWVQAEPFGTQVVRHTRLPSATLHSPRQQSALFTQATPCGRQVVGPKSQRSVVSLHTSQQPRPVPLVQSSPVGRQSRLGSSIAHSPRPRSQMFEQHSALAVQGSPSTTQRPPPHFPPKQPSEQQSTAFSQLAPSGRQNAVQRRSG